MSETTEQFLARFRATGLDMLCEARRREEQRMPFTWGHRTATGRYSMSNPALWFISKGGKPYRSPVERFYAPPDNAYGFINMDFSDIERRVETHLTAVRPDYPPPRTLTGQYEGVHPDPGRKYVVMKGRSVGRSYLQQSTAAMLMGEGMGNLVFDMEALTLAFGDATQTMAEWAASVQSGLRRSARIYPHEVKVWEPQKPPGRSLGPGKEVEDPNGMTLNRKRIEKERRRKKLAKKSRK